MSLISIFSFTTALFILAATPGPGVFAVVSRSLASGFIPSLGVIVGIIIGDIFFLLFAILGLSVIAQSMGNFFVVVKIIGGAYLIFLGIKIWISKPVPVQEANRKKNMKYGNFLSGLFITLSNPKVILFYCGFLPTFMDLSSLSKFDICIVATTVSIVLASVLVIYAYLANRARLFFYSSRSVRRLNKAAGGVMIATGAVIAAKS
ncbi:MAG: LysE family translocator [Desulfobacteraceae bacterium]|nr:LysE family translocator [Desulfobacteraceae bacterium]